MQYPEHLLPKPDKALIYAADYKCLKSTQQ